MLKRHSNRRGSSTVYNGEGEGMVDLESSELELKVHTNRAKKRVICHLKLSVVGSNNDIGGDQCNIIEFKLIMLSRITQVIIKI